MSEIGRWDYQCPGKRLQWCDTFSIGIFQWIPAKTTKSGTKRSRAVLRIQGFSHECEVVCNLARLVAHRLNRLGIQYSDIIQRPRRSNRRRYSPGYWAHSATSCTPAQVAKILINELVGRKEMRCPLCDSPYTVERDGGKQGICLQCGESFINRGKDGT